MPRRISGNLRMKPEAKVPKLRFGTVLDDLLSLIFDACSRLAGVI